jgi:hypothetical protein
MPLKVTAIRAMMGSNLFIDLGVLVVQGLNASDGLLTFFFRADPNSFLDF